VNIVFIPQHRRTLFDYPRLAGSRVTPISPEHRERLNALLADEKISIESIIEYFTKGISNAGHRKGALAARDYQALEQEDGTIVIAAIYEHEGVEYVNGTLTFIKDKEKEAVAEVQIELPFDTSFFSFTTVRDHKIILEKALETTDVDFTTILEKIQRCNNEKRIQE